MNALCLLASCLLGQYAGSFGTGYNPYPYGVTPGYRSRTGAPSWFYDPIGYSRFYSGAGYYPLGRQVIANPKVIVPRRAPMSLPGVTGRVVALDEGQRLITVRLPAETVRIHYGPETSWRSVGDEFPEIKAGAIINADVEQGTITVLRPGASD